MTFEKDFPGLKGKEIGYDEASYKTIEFKKLDIQKHCLDKQKVKEGLNEIQKHIGKKGLNIMYFDWIEELKKELKL